MPSDGQSKVTCLAVGDPHFQVNNVQDTEELIVKVNKLVEQLQPTFVVILGDLLHTHEKIHVTPFNLATKFITSLASKVQVFLIIGNHDYCLAKNTPVLMWNGDIKLSQDIAIGDKLAGDDDTPRTVKKLVRGKAPMYTIEQSNGDTYKVTTNHTLSLKCITKKSKRYCILLSQWVVEWLRPDYSIGIEYCATKSDAEKLLDQIIDIDIIDIPVIDYIQLPQKVRNMFNGYRKGDNITSKLTIIEPPCLSCSKDDYYGWELDGNHRFLLGDNTVTHNCNNQQFLTDRHAFNSFKKIDNVVVCDKVISRTINGHKFIFCPYTPPERFEEALDTLKVKNKTWMDAACIFAHQEFYGCRFNPVMTSTEGDIWPDEYPLVVSGHIHDAQMLQENIYYTGSSMQHAFGESANKTIALLCFSGKFSLKKIDLELRKKKIVYLDVDNAKEFIPEENVSTKLVLRGTSEQFKVFRRGNIYKDLQKLGIAISFSPTLAVEPVHNSHKKSVLDILEDMIKNDNKYVKKAYEELIE